MKTHRKHRRRRTYRRRHSRTYRRRKGGMLRKLTSDEFNGRFMRQTYNLRPEDQDILDRAETARLANTTTSPPTYPPNPTSLLEPALEEEQHINISEAAMIDKNPWWNATQRFEIFDWVYQICKIRNDYVNKYLKAPRNNTLPVFVNYFLATQIIDQYISATGIAFENYQTVAAAAILLASKYEDVYAIQLKDIVYYINPSPDQYTKTVLSKMINKMETAIVTTLTHPYAPTLYTFFQLKKDATPREQHAYLLQLICCASVIQQFIGMLPSKIVDLCINYIARTPTNSLIPLPFLPFSVSMKGKTFAYKFTNFMHIYAAIMAVA